ncbi:hypothetical protein B0T24DRAFT_152172 [Lasiosphaeria ovina]|uniref:Uncharacterized protein n=1 Tax=Lasiosphaeria ovina TaxID=92902 RepID=A0AAE0ND58_9PEZI|nr:hypothetical protein B0T24DRAFT_152172 [Lasiosphaeria ovina]
MEPWTWNELPLAVLALDRCAGFYNLYPHGERMEGTVCQSWEVSWSEREVPRCKCKWGNVAAPLQTAAPFGHLHLEQSFRLGFAYAAVSHRPASDIADSARDTAAARRYLRTLRWIWPRETTIHKLPSTPPAQLRSMLTLHVELGISNCLFMASNDARHLSGRKLSRRLDGQNEPHNFGPCQVPA